MIDSSIVDNYSSFSWEEQTSRLQKDLSISHPKEAAEKFHEDSVDANVYEEKKEEESVVAQRECERIFTAIGKKAADICAAFAAKRRNHMKFAGSLPSSLQEVALPFVPNSAYQSMAQTLTNETLAEFRRAVFSIQDLGDVSTSSLRHTCMGILADSFRVYIRLVGDCDSLAEKICGGISFDSKCRARLAFLGDIEANAGAMEACRYSVISSTAASSAAKSAVRQLYLDLLAEKHHMTPSHAQELVPGFRYDYISLDEAVDLIELQTETQKIDQEIDQFILKLSKAKQLETRVKPRISEGFVERLRGKLASSVCRNSSAIC